MFDLVAVEMRSVPVLCFFPWPPKKLLCLSVTSKRGMRSVALLSHPSAAGGFFLFGDGLGGQTGELSRDINADSCPTRFSEQSSAFKGVASIRSLSFFSFAAAATI